MNSYFTFLSFLFFLSKSCEATNIRTGPKSLVDPLKTSKDKNGNVQLYKQYVYQQNIQQGRELQELQATGMISRDLQDIGSVLGCITSADPLGCVLQSVLGVQSGTVFDCIFDGTNLLNIACYLNSFLPADDPNNIFGPFQTCLTTAGTTFDLGCYLAAVAQGVFGQDSTSLAGQFANCISTDAFNLGCYLNAIVNGLLPNSPFAAFSNCFLANAFDIVCYLDAVLGGLAGGDDGDTANNQTAVPEEEEGTLNPEDSGVTGSGVVGLLACYGEMTPDCMLSSLWGEGVAENSAFAYCVLFNSTMGCYTQAILPDDSQPNEDGNMGDTMGPSFEDIKDMIVNQEPGDLGDTDTSENDDSGSWWSQLINLLP